MGTIWDGGWPELGEDEREALRAQEYEPDEVDLAPGTEPPPKPELDGPNEPSMRHLIDSRRAARRLWAEVLRWIQGARKMIGVRPAHLWLLLVLVLACRNEPASGSPAGNRTKGMAGELHCVNGRPQIEMPLPELHGFERIENVRHEATHGAQFAADCAATAERWAEEPTYRLELEAEATCNGIEAWPTDSLRRFRKGLAAARITQTYLASQGNTVGFEDVYAALDRWCGF